MERVQNFRDRAKALDAAGPRELAMSEENIETVKRFFEAVAREDWAAVEGFFDPDGEIHDFDIADASIYRGPKGFLDWIAHGMLRLYQGHGGHTAAHTQSASSVSNGVGLTSPDHGLSAQAELVFTVAAATGVLGHVRAPTAIIVAMVGSNTSKKTVDPSAVLNSVCHEGWELVDGDFVFVQTGQQSRDKFISSGQNVSIAGTVMGYYLFRRCEANRVAETDEELTRRLAGWDDAELEAATVNQMVSCPECAQQFTDLESYTAHYQATHQDQPAELGG